MASKITGPFKVMKDGSIVISEGNWRKYKQAGWSWDKTGVGSVVLASDDGREVYVTYAQAPNGVFYAHLVASVGDGLKYKHTWGLTMLDSVTKFFNETWSEFITVA